MSAPRPGTPVILSWSSGKDSAWALHVLRQSGYEVAALLTTFTAPEGRVSMHGVLRDLVEAQAHAARCDLWPVTLPEAPSNEEYGALMAAAMARARDAGVATVAFGDLFLEDIRAYRESQLARAGMSALFPLWGSGTSELAREMIAAGLCATVVSVDTAQAPASLAGREWDEDLLRGLPAGIDPCGENGEFHTFAHAGPMFRAPIAIALGGVTTAGPFATAALRRA